MSQIQSREPIREEAGKTQGTQEISQKRDPLFLKLKSTQTPKIKRSSGWSKVFPES
jgi:hypothetical protein